jgi:hypothetical protein
MCVVRQCTGLEPSTVWRPLGLKPYPHGEETSCELAKPTIIHASQQETSLFVLRPTLCGCVRFIYVRFLWSAPRLATKLVALPDEPRRLLASSRRGRACTQRTEEGAGRSRCVREAGRRTALTHGSRPYERRGGYHGGSLALRGATVRQWLHEGQRRGQEKVHSALKSKSAL